MSYDDFDINDIIKSRRLMFDVINKLSVIDIIKDGLIDVRITSKFPNIYYYKSVSKSLLVNQDTELLTEFNIKDYYKEMRLIDFLKDTNNDISHNYSKYFKEFLIDVMSLMSAYENAVYFKELSYDIFRSNIFKQYIINVVYICVDVYNAIS